MSKLTNNFFDAPEPARAAVRRPIKSTAPDSDEDPDESSVPEGPSNLNASFMRRTIRTPSPGGSPSVPLSDTLPTRISGGFTGPASGQGASTASATASAARRMAGMNISEPDNGSTMISGGRSGYDSAAPAGPMTQPPAPRPSPPHATPPAGFPAGSRRPGLGIGAGYGSMDLPPPSSNWQQQGRGMQASRPQGRVQHDMQVQEVDDFEDDFGGVTGGPSALGGTLGGSLSIRPAGKGSSLSLDTAKALRALLWGGQGAPPASWKQGFYFNNRPGLQFGLVQREGGPCGILAGVQAHIMANLRTPTGSFNLHPSVLQQQTALASALADLLWQARLGPQAVVAQAAPEAGVSASSLGYDQLMRSIVVYSASTKEELVDILRACLPTWMEPSGWGLLLLLKSLVLSKGVEGVARDMDEPSNALMGMHGYCTQELVNLIITGQAVSNVFDGNRDLDGSVLKGITRRCKLGLLTLFEWYKYVEVGASLKSPELPVWVVCSESHFTLLFAQDDKPLRGKLPFDLLYYDQLANQEEIIHLSVADDPRGGWTGRVGNTIGDRGKCEGQNIPPLECVIETKWPGVKVDWNGAEPIL